MQGRRWQAAGLSVAPFLILALSGCSDAVVPVNADNANSTVPATLAVSFQPEKTGTIKGHVAWEGSRPEVPPFQVAANPNFYPPWPERQSPKPFPNPNAPRINSAGGVGDAVVFLRRVDLDRSRIWDHGPVTAAFQDYQILLTQDQITAATAFIQRGSAVNFLSREERYHILRARGAAFFDLAFPKPDQPRLRTLTQSGVVELSSGAEYYWLRAYLFVSEHPYYTRTDAHGDFSLPAVPEGDYELVAWLPNWLEAGHDRNPDMMFYSRLTFRPPVERVQPVRVTAGHVTDATFAFRTELFGK